MTSGGFSSLTALISRLRGGCQTLEMVKTYGSALTTAKHILVLDSSFNPPTVAHRALALIPTGTAASEPDAMLLLLSVTNADKVPKSGDALPEQRLEMMELVARGLYDRTPLARTKSVS